jgi:hypothetical protein
MTTKTTMSEESRYSCAGLHVAVVKKPNTYAHYGLTVTTSKSPESRLSRPHRVIDEPYLRLID